jgi:hypothetical protein
LGPRVRAWPAERATARVADGIDVLETIARNGSDGALLQLWYCAERTRFPDLIDRSRGAVARVAEVRAIPRDELEDRLVPDLGLDESGALVLDDGKMRVVLDEQLAPIILDAAGERKRTVPKSCKSTYKAFKTDLETIARAQIARFEKALREQRTWNAEAFRTLAAHPLLKHLVRRLVWASGATTFRVAEDGTIAGPDDAPMQLPTDPIRIVHPIDLADRVAWGTVFGDYEILQPFPQLDREVFVPTDVERAAPTTDRFRGRTAQAGRLYALEHRGWRRSGEAYSLVVEVDVTAQIGFTGSVYDGEVTLGTLGIFRARSPADRITFGKLAPIACSELLRDVAMVC